MHCLFDFSSLKRRLVAGFLCVGAVRRQQSDLLHDSRTELAVQLVTTRPVTSGIDWWASAFIVLGYPGDALLCVFWLCADLRWPPWSGGYHCKSLLDFSIRPSALCSRHIKPLWSMIELVKNPPAGKKLEFITPSSTTDAWITALTPGHDFQHKHTSTEMFKGTSSCASVFFPLFYVTFHQNRGLHVNGCSGIAHEHLAVCSAPGFFFLFFKNQLWLNYVLNKYSIVCVLKCPALMHFWIIGILTPGSQLLLHTPESNHHLICVCLSVALFTLYITWAFNEMWAASYHSIFVARAMITSLEQF